MRGKRGLNDSERRVEERLIAAGRLRFGVSEEERRRLDDLIARHLSRAIKADSERRKTHKRPR